MQNGMPLANAGWPTNLVATTIPPTPHQANTPVQQKQRRYDSPPHRHRQQQPQQQPQHYHHQQQQQHQPQQHQRPRSHQKHQSPRHFHNQHDRQRPSPMVQQPLPDPFTESVEQILAAEENRPDNGLLASEINRLSQLCSLQQQKQQPRPVKSRARNGLVENDIGLGFADVDPDLIGQLISLLEQHARTAAQVNLIHETTQILHANIESIASTRSGCKTITDQWLHGAGTDCIDDVQRGLEAASILLFLITSPGMSRKAVSEDAMEATIVLLRHHIGEHILPALNHIGHLPNSSKSYPASVSPQSANKKRRRMNGTTPNKQPNGKSGNSEEGRVQQDATMEFSEVHATIVKRELKKIYKHISGTIGSTVLVMERLQSLVLKIPMEDQHIFHLSAGVLKTLELDPPHVSEISIAHQLHDATVGIISSIFRQYPNHRSIVMEDLFPIMLKLPTSKKTIRTFPVHCSSVLVPSGLVSLSKSLAAQATTSSRHSKEQQMIQTMSALLLACIQNVVDRPTHQSVADTSVGSPLTAALADSQDSQQQQQRWVLQSGLKGAQAICDSFVQHLVARCARKGEEGGASEFRPILGHLIDDLLVLVLVPEYPAAEMLLLSIASFLSRDLMRANKSARALQAVESTYLNTAFDVLGKICAAEAKVLAEYREKPVRLPTKTVVPQLLHNDEGDNEEDNKVDCYCQTAAAATATGAINTMDDDVDGHLPPSQDDRLMLDCDRCHTWFHAPCVGLSRETVPPEWFCDACQLGRIVEYERDRYANLDEGWAASVETTNHPKFLTEEFAMRRLCLDYLAHVSTQTQHQSGPFSAKGAYEFHMARWINEEYSLMMKSQEHQLSCAASPPSSPLLARLFDLWDPAEALDGCSSNGRSPRNSKTLSGMLHCISDEGRSRMVIHLAATKSALLSSFKSQVELIVKLMGTETASSVRKLGVKAIERVTDADPKLMLYTFLKKAVINRFSDESISVREAAVSLVGSYVVHTPAVANAFHYAFLTGLNDPGVSVRKRTVKILQDVLCSNPSYKGRAQACSELLKLAADPKEDDGVRDLIHDLFLKVWLENGEDRVTQEVITSQQHFDGNAPCVPQSSFRSPSLVEDLEYVGPNGVPLVSPTPEHHPVKSMETPAGKSTRSTARKIRTTIQKGRAEIAAEQMMEVVKASNGGENLTVLLRELLSGVSEADKSRKSHERRRRQVVAQNHCAMLVDALIEMLLSIEEKRSTFDKDNEEVGKTLVATMRSIQVFSEVSPAVLLHHLDTLLPYLKADNGVAFEEEAAIVTSVSKSISHLSSSLDGHEVERLASTSLAQDLVKITYKFGKDALAAAVEVLCTLSHHDECKEGSVLRQKLLELANTFYQFLLKHVGFDDMSMIRAKIRMGVQRGLSVLGSICRFHAVQFQSLDVIQDHDEGADNGDDSDGSDGDNEGNGHHKADTTPKMTWSTVSSLSKSIFLKYMDKRDPGTKCAALRALGGIFIAHPREMFEMDQRGLMADVMAPTSHITLQLEALRVWREILLAEEARIESGAAKAKMEASQGMTVSKRVSGDQDGDATLFGGVLTSHADRLFAMTQSVHPRLRLATIDLIGHLLRQGQINPIETVPYLLALQGDVNEEQIRSTALKLIMIEGQKRTDMLRQRVCAGIKQAYKFQRLVYPNNESASALIKVKRLDQIRVECVFGSVFEECIKSCRKQRQGLFRNLLSLFDIDDQQAAFSEQTPSANETPTKQQLANNRRRKSRLDMISNSIFDLDLPLLSFTAQVLAHLPYSSPTDPLYIIHNISSKLALDGVGLVDRLAAFLRPHGLSASDELDENNVGEDALERAAVKNKPCEAEEVAAMRKSNFDKLEFARLCGEASAMTLLLRLKSFLRDSFSLSEARILSFDVEVKERWGDKVSSKAHMFAFEASLSLTAVPKNKKEVSIDSLIYQYSEFRRLMRLEATIEAKSEDSDFDDEPVSSTKKRKRLSFAQELQH